MKKIPELEELARTLVGDNKKPDMFFVSYDGNISLVTTDFNAAYHYWREITQKNRGETALENRTWGVICDRSPVEEGSKKLATYDDHRAFIRENRGVLRNSLLF